eukprot:gene38532-43658_t
MIVMVVSQVVGLNKVGVRRMVYVNTFWDIFMLGFFWSLMFITVLESVFVTMVMEMVVNANISMVVTDHFSDMGFSRVIFASKLFPRMVFMNVMLVTVVSGWFCILSNRMVKLFLHNVFYMRLGMNTVK